MKKLMATVIIVSVLFAGSSAFAQTQASEPVMPDYSSWDKASLEVAGSHNGQPVTLSAELYMNTDLVNLKRYFVYVVNDETGGAWLGYLTVQTGEKQADGSIVVKETYLYFFEKSPGGWKMVQDFSKSADPLKESNSLLLSKYGLQLQ